MLSGHLVASNHWRALEVVRTIDTRGLPEVPDLREAYELMRRGVTPARTCREDCLPGRDARRNNRPGPWGILDVMEDARCPQPSPPPPRRRTRPAVAAAAAPPADSGGHSLHEFWTARVAHPVDRDEIRPLHPDEHVSLPSVGGDGDTQRALDYGSGQTSQGLSCQAAAC